jgi:MtN3 and saliva related transmembrane protein
MKWSVEAVGTVAALCTTLCWLPQTIHILRKKRTEGVSLVTQSVFSLGVALWLAYGLLLGSWPLIIANLTTLFLSLTIVALKLLYG